MKDITLREVCVVLGVTRRAVQGYENAGLVSATGKTGRGYLLYDEQAQQRIQQIKLFQEMGFSIKEIKEIMDAPRHVLRAALQKQVGKMQEEIQKKEAIIKVAEEMIEAL